MVNTFLGYKYGLPIKCKVFKWNVENEWMIGKQILYEAFYRKLYVWMQTVFNLFYLFYLLSCSLLFIYKYFIQTI